MLNNKEVKEVEKCKWEGGREDTCGRKMGHPLCAYQTCYNKCVMYERKEN